MFIHWQKFEWRILCLRVKGFYGGSFMNCKSTQIRSSQRYNVSAKDQIVLVKFEQVESRDVWSEVKQDLGQFSFCRKCGQKVPAHEIKNSHFQWLFKKKFIVLATAQHFCLHTDLLTRDPMIGFCWRTILHRDMANFLRLFGEEAETAWGVVIAGLLRRGNQVSLCKKEGHTVCDLKTAKHQPEHTNGRTGRLVSQERATAHKWVVFG